LKRCVFTFLGNGERVRHYKGYYNEAEDFTKELGLEKG
jgi:hypothetical protein